MRYKYETHVHSQEASICGESSIREMVRAYHAAGYTGMFVTDHFMRGNTSVPKTIPWIERMKMYYDVYLIAKEEADKFDFDVFFGAEYHYEKSREVLAYGVDIDLFVNHPELERADIEVFAQAIHEAGGILIHSHPYRERAYIPTDFEPRLDVCDGVEVYNAHDPWESNRRALEESLKLRKLPLSGGDMHNSRDETIGKAGIVLGKRVKNMDEFIEEVRKQEYNILIDGIEYSLKELDNLI